MAKRNVLTIKVSVDTKNPEEFITEIVAHPDTPIKNISDLLEGVAFQMKKDGSKTLGETIQKVN
jgi:hypothetical protein